MEVSDEIVTEAVAWRRHLHQYPELAYQEHRTSEFIASRLSKWGYSVHVGLAGTGVVGTLTRGSSRRSIGIRADMDALPITEQTGVPHASRHAGIMHACGHDGHVAIALAAARAAARLAGIDGTLHFIFQPAEEGEGGARRMVEEGVFRRFPCDSVYALHNWPALPIGTCVAQEGPVMAASATFEVVMSGRGCHGAMPQEGSDSILASSQLVCSLQSIVSRSVSPGAGAVVSVTQLHGGDTWNVIPDRCVIRGTARWLEESVGIVLERRIRQISASVAVAFGCEASVRFERRVPATVNDPESARRVREVAGAHPGLTVVRAMASMGSEDFACMLETTPGCYVWLGAKGEGNFCGLHSPRYDFNDELVPIGSTLWLALIRRSLAPP